MTSVPHPHLLPVPPTPSYGPLHLFARRPLSLANKACSVLPCAKLKCQGINAFGSSPHPETSRSWCMDTQQSGVGSLFAVPWCPRWLPIFPGRIKLQTPTMETGLIMTPPKPALPSPPVVLGVSSQINHSRFSPCLGSASGWGAPHKRKHLAECIFSVNLGSILRLSFFQGYHSVKNTKRI